MKILICRLLMVESLRRAVQMGWAKCKITRITEYYLLFYYYILYDIYFICNNSNNVLLLDKWVGLSAGLQGLSSANLLHYYYQYINVYQNSYSYSLSSIGSWKTRIVLKLSSN